MTLADSEGIRELGPYGPWPPAHPGHPFLHCPCPTPSPGHILQHPGRSESPPELFPATMPGAETRQGSGPALPTARAQLVENLLLRALAWPGSFSSWQGEGQLVWGHHPERGQLLPGLAGSLPQWLKGKGRQAEKRGLSRCDLFINSGAARASTATENISHPGRAQLAKMHLMKTHAASDRAGICIPKLERRRKHKNLQDKTCLRLLVFVYSLPYVFLSFPGS